MCDCILRFVGVSIFLQCLYMLCCSGPRQLCIKRVSEIGTFDREGRGHQGHESRKASSFHSQNSEHKTRTFPQASRSHESPPDRVASFRSSPWRRRFCLCIRGGDDRRRTQNKEMSLLTDGSRGQTSANILSVPHVECLWYLASFHNCIRSCACSRVCLCCLCVSSYCSHSSAGWRQ